MTENVERKNWSKKIGKSGNQKFGKSDFLITKFFRNGIWNERDTLKYRKPAASQYRETAGFMFDLFLSKFRSVEGQRGEVVVDGFGAADELYVAVFL